MVNKSNQRGWKTEILLFYSNLTNNVIMKSFVHDEVMTKVKLSDHFELVTKEDFPEQIYFIDQYRLYVKQYI